MMVTIHFLRQRLAQWGLFMAMAMLVPGAVRATCTSIGEYMMPNGRRVVFFGDNHIDSFDGAKAEQDVFIAAAREQGAYCIVEDGLGYKGNDLLVRNMSDEWIYEWLIRLDGEHVDYPMTALLGLAGRCVAEGIECHNVEYRYAELVYTWCVMKGRGAEELVGLRESIIQQIEEAFCQVRENHDMNQDMAAALRNKCDHVIADLRHRSDAKHTDDLVAECNYHLFDGKLVIYLEQLLANDADTRPIFIFVGEDHSDVVQALLCQKYNLDQNVYRRRSRFRAAMDYRRIGYRSDQSQRQEEARKFLAQHRVDIRGYFAKEKSMTNGAAECVLQ